MHEYELEGFSTHLKKGGINLFLPCFTNLLCVGFQSLEAVFAPELY